MSLCLTLVESWKNIIVNMKVLQITGQHLLFDQIIKLVDTAWSCRPMHAERGKYFIISSRVVIRVALYPLWYVQPRQVLTLPLFGKCDYQYSRLPKS